MGNVIQLLATLGRLLMDGLARLGLAALLALAVLGVALGKWGSPTLAWTTVTCAAAAIFAVRAYLNTDGRLVHKGLLISALCLLALPPLWIALNLEPPVVP